MDNDLKQPDTNVPVPSESGGIGEVFVGLPRLGAEYLLEKIKWLESCNSNSLRVAQNLGLENYQLRQEIELLRDKFESHDHAPCIYCDPLRSELAAKQQEIAALEEELAGGASMTPEDPYRQFWKNCGWTHTAPY